MSKKVLKIPFGTEEIENRAYYQRDDIKEVIISETVTEIGFSAFAECPNLEKVTIPSTVTAIKYGTFAGCTSLKEVILPQGITYLAGRAFMGCTSLEEFKVPEGLLVIRQDAFKGCRKLLPFRIPDRCVLRRHPWDGTLMDRVAKDDVTIVNDLGTCDADHIDILLEMAMSKGKVNVTAALLEYKAAHFTNTVNLDAVLDEFEI